MVQHRPSTLRLLPEADAIDSEQRAWMAWFSLATLPFIFFHTLHHYKQCSLIPYFTFFPLFNIQRMNPHWVRNSAWKKSENIQIDLLQGSGRLRATDRITFLFLLLAVCLCRAWQRCLTDRTKLYFLLVLVWCCQPELSIFGDGRVRSEWALWAHRRTEQWPADRRSGQCCNPEPHQPCWEGSLSIYQTDSKAAKGAAEASFAKDRHNAEKYAIAASDWIYLWFNCWTVSLVI